MKRSLFFTCMVMIFTLPALTQTYTIQFEKPQLITTPDGYTVVLYDNCTNFGKEGAPEMPYYGADFLLPPNHELSYIHLISATYFPTETSIKIKPAVKPVPISQYQGEAVELEPDPAIYGSSEPYPGSMLGENSTNYLSGHSIASFTICPVVYIPATGEVKFLQELVLEVGSLPTDRASEASLNRKYSSLIETRINQIVYNPEVITSYSYPAYRDGEEYDLLLISNNALITAFDNFVEYKQSTGYFVKTITTEEIYGSYSGSDNQDKIRNCIKDYYQNYGISYVILGGDGDPNSGTDNIIPSRGLIALDDDDIASDMYYAGLDGNWNTDGDNYWGEPGEWDLYSEVSIGRICVDNIQEIEFFTHKIISYQNSPVVGDVEKAVMVGEQLNSNTWGGTYKDEIANGSSANGYTTVGFPANFTMTTLYEMDQMWYKEDIFEQFNEVGVNLLNHLGHSNVNYNMKMYNSDLTTTNFTNNGITRTYVIGYSQGCYNGSFDNRNDGGGYGSDCFAEQFTNLQTGEVASIANSRYGWYNPGGTNSSSQYYDRQFFDAIFGENITQVGDVNAQSKEDDVSYIQDDEYCRWTAYELNLFGDPSMDIWTETPSDIVADIPVSIPIGSTSVFIETDAPYARVAISKIGDLIGRGIADANGDVTVEFPMVTDPAPLDVMVTAHNRIPLTAEILVIANQPYLIFASYLLNDVSGNNNGSCDYGENIYLSLTIKNVGDQPAYNTSVTISTDNEYVNLIDNSQMYGIIPAGESKTITDAFNFEVAPDIPDQTIIHFDISIVADDTWEDEMEMAACAPLLTSGAIFFNDTLGGNSSASIDPGEIITVVIPVMNNGHSNGYGATVTLSSTSEFAVIDAPFIDIGDMPTYTIMNLEFTVEVDDYAPIGTYIDLTLDFTCGEYNYQHTYTGMVGLIFENWETGDFSKFPWSSSSQMPFMTCMVSPYEGNFCVRSGQIVDEESSNIKVTYNCVVDDSISFFRKVSSEEDADYLQFYIDNTLVDQWAGMFDWERFCYPVTAGVHTFKWVYMKNASEIKGLDCAWIDYIVFPPTTVTTCYPGSDTTICVGEDYQCHAAAANYTSIEWSTSGTGDFSNPNTLDPVYAPSQADYNSGMVILSLTAYSNLPCGDISRNLELSFHPLPAVPEMPMGPDYVDLFYTTTSEYTVLPVPDATGYIWLLDPESAGWISGNDTLATVDWNATFLGNVEISVKAENICGDGDYSESLVVTVDNTVGTGQTGKQDIQVRIVPNPTNGIFKLEVSSVQPQEIVMTIVNASGAEIYQSGKLNVQKQFVKEFDLTSYPEGVYYLRIDNDGSNILKKLVIIK
jgi:hypothetical protein